MFIFISTSAWTPLSYIFTKLNFYAVLRPATRICAKKCPPFMRSRANKAYCLPLLGCVTVTFIHRFIIATCVKLYGPHGKTCRWRFEIATLPRRHSTGNWEVNFQLSTWRLDSLLTCKEGLCVFIFFETCPEFHRTLRPFAICSYTSKNAKRSDEHTRKKKEDGIGIWPVNFSIFRWRRQGHPSKRQSC